MILRPSIVFGPEDDFFNRFARMAQIKPGPAADRRRRTRFQPVFVGDVGKAAGQRGERAGGAASQTYELGGPAAYSFRQLMEMMLAEIGKRRFLAPLPWPAANMLGAVGDLANGVAGAIGLSLPTTITADQVFLLNPDNVVSGACPGLAELGITPPTLEAVLPSYLYVYRKGGQYADQDAREMAAI